MYKIKVFYLLLSITIVGGCYYKSPVGPEWRPVTTHTIATFNQDVAGRFTTSSIIPLTKQELAYLMPNIEREGASGRLDVRTSPLVEQINYIVSPIVPFSTTEPTIGFPVEVRFTSTTSIPDPFVGLAYSGWCSEDSIPPCPSIPGPNTVAYYNWLYFSEGTVAIDSAEGNIFYNDIRRVMMYKPGSTPKSVIGVRFTTDTPIIGYCNFGSDGYASPYYPYCPQGDYPLIVFYNSYLYELHQPFYATYEFTDSSSPYSTNIKTFTYEPSDMSSMDRTKVLLPPVVKLAVTNNDTIYFAIKNTIYQTSLQSNVITITASLPISEEVVSMKVDNNSGLLYAATEHIDYFSDTALAAYNLPVRPATGYLWKIDPLQHTVTLLAGRRVTYGEPESTPYQSILPLDIAIDSTGRYLFFIDGSPPLSDAVGSHINVLDLKQNKIYYVNGLHDKPGSSKYGQYFYMNLYFTSTATTATLYASVQGIDVNTPEYKSLTSIPTYSIETISWPLP